MSQPELQRRPSVDSNMTDPQTGRKSALTRIVLLKLDWRVLPSCSLLWLACFIDRSNIGNANVAGLGKDLGLHGLQFNTALAVFYAPYIAIELVSGYALRYFGGRVWLPALVFWWGVVTICSGWMSSYAGLIVVRLALGLCEGGLLPGLVWYLSTLYRRRELQLRVGAFYSAASLSGAFGGLLAFVIVKMDGIRGRPGWAWIFILEGCATVLIAFFAWWQLPNGIQKASFLSAEEKQHLLRRLKADAVETSSAKHRDDDVSVEEKDKATDGRLEDSGSDAPRVEVSAHEQFEWYEVRRGFKEPQVWITGIAYMSICVVLYSISLFLPTIVNNQGYHAASAQLHSAYPFLPAAGLTVVAAFFCDRYRIRGPCALLLLPLSMIGYIMAIVTTSNRVRYASVFLMTLGVYPSVPAVLCIVANNTAGLTKRNTVTALQLMLCNLAGFVASFQYTSRQAPRFIKGHAIALGFTILAWLLIFVNCMWCLRENRLRAAGKRDDNVAKYLQLVADGRTRAPIGDRDPAWRYYI